MSFFSWSGAPLGLRVESIHGYKMVKNLHKIEWIEDYRTVGDGMGGTEDSSLQSINAKISGASGNPARSTATWGVSAPSGGGSPSGRHGGRFKSSSAPRTVRS